MAARGATVVAIARRADLLAETNLPFDVCDITDTGSLTAALGRVEEAHGRIDILVNAAGIERRVGAGDLTLDEVRRIMGVNFDAAVAGTLAVLPGMLRRGAGVICNVSS